MLGFIGGIVGPVAGLLTYEDGEAIDNKLQELNEAQANISHLVGLQTHVVKAQLHDLHEQASKNEEKLKYYEHQLSQVAQNLHDVTRFYEGYNYTHALGRLLMVIEAALDDYTRAADNLKTVIQTARRGEMHVSMLFSQQLEPVIQDIQDQVPRLEFPVAGPEISVEELAKVATTTIIYKKGMLKILLDIPLLQEFEYSLHKIQPLLVNQPAFKNRSGRAYILSDYSHIVMEESKRTYMLMKQKDIESCTKLNYYLCQTHLPVFETAKHESCESELLIRPSMATLKECNIRVSYQDQPKWIYLETLGA